LTVKGFSYGEADTLAFGAGEGSLQSKHCISLFCLFCFTWVKMSALFTLFLFFRPAANDRYAFKRAIKGEVSG
jgi:hypothetical protein